MKKLLLILLSFVALTSIVSGIVLILHPDGMIMGLSQGLLARTIFPNFQIPGLLMAFLVGGTQMLAIIDYSRWSTHRYNRPMLAGAVICGWIVIQMVLILELSWLQFFYLATGLLIILIAYQLKGKWAV
jgi:hypothetical protein